MVSAPTLDVFLTGAKLALRNAVRKKQPVMLVLGNEEADLDSCASAILFAYLRTASPARGAFSEIYIPLINNERSSIVGDELFSRVLPHVSIKEDHFITVDDLVQHGSTRSGLAEENTRFFLVNQNVMLGRENQNYSRNVAGCIDNHADAGYVPMQTDPEPRIIGKSASCTSLVVNWGRSAWESLDVTERKSSEGQLAKLALAAILVDTHNLEDSSVVKNDDVLAVDFLVSRISANDSSFDRHAFYSEITNRKPQRPAPPRQASSRQPFFVDSSPVAQIQPTSTKLAPAPPLPEVVEPVPVVEPVHVVEPTRAVESTYVVETVPGVRPGAWIASLPATSTVPGVETSSVVETASTSTPNYTRSTVPLTNYYTPRYLSDILAEGYHGPTIEKDHQIGVSHTTMDLAQLVTQAERDLVNRAIEEATSGCAPESESTKATSRVLKGTPFTAAVRDFAEERGLSVFAITTEGEHGKELLLWALNPSLSLFVPIFAQNHEQGLALKAWAGEKNIAKEAGISESMMRAFWTSGVSPKELSGMLAQGI